MFRQSLFVLLLFCSCAGSRMVETNLYFGRSRLDGGSVSQVDWNSFMEKHICKVFPEGSTVMQATGHWYDTASRKVVEEPSWLLIAVNKPSAKRMQQIDSLRYWYKILHNQQSVLWVQKKIKARLF